MSTRNLWDKGPVPVSHETRPETVPRRRRCHRCRSGFPAYLYKYHFIEILYSGMGSTTQRKRQNFLKERMGQGTCPRVPSGEFFPCSLEAVDDGKMLRTCSFAGSALDAFVRGLAILKDHVHIPVLFRICVVKGYIVPG